MRNIREVLRQKWVLRRSHREVARSLGISAGFVGGLMVRVAQLGLDWRQVQAMTEEVLEERLYGGKAAPGVERPMPDPAYLHAERRRPGVTLELLHMEYLEKHPNGYRYTQFCEIYRQWLGKQRLSMRQVHRAGEKMFVDYSGKRPHIVDPTTGECIDVELFVAVLGASSYTFAEATRSQRGPDFVGSHTRAFEYFEGVARAVVPDQLKSGVTKACRYEPGIQRTYQEMARHYGTAILPARPARPRDKAKVERAVQIAQRWILARLRNETFFSLEALNTRIRELLEELNSRKMRVYGVSRRELFERMDKPALLPLPTERFSYAEWKRVRVSIDYHVTIGGHFYSAPYTLVHEELEARFTLTAVELFRRGQRVTSHPRSFKKGGFTTRPEHMPKAHQKHLEWTPSRLIHWASTLGPNTEGLVKAILANRPHPEMGYRSCLGILRLGKRYGDARLEAACGRALAVNARSYRHLESILSKGLDRVPLQPDRSRQGELGLGEHENVRGREYYH